MKLAKRLMIKPAGGGSWTPAEITTAAWWDVSDSAARVLDGTAISQLTDKSGNSRNATMTSTSRPTLSGGLATFDGSNDYMIVSVPQVQTCHIFTVIDTTALQTGYRTLLERSATGSPYPPALYLGCDSGPYKPTVYWGTAKAIIDGTARRALRIQEYRLGASTLGLRSGGGAEQSASHSLTALTTWTKINTTADTTQNGAYSFGEILIINSALSDANRQKIEGYLAHKWDALLGVTTLVSALPSGHAYKTSAP